MLLPPSDRLFVKHIPTMASAEGLVLSEAKPEKTPLGEVITMGAEAKQKLPDVSEGDRVYYKGGEKVTVEGETLILLSPPDVVCSVVYE